MLPEADGNCSRLIEMRPTPISSGLKWLTFGLTILLLLMILDYYRFQLKVERQRLRAPDLQLWHIKRLFAALLAELVVCGLHPLPFLKSLDEDVQVSNPYGFFGESRWTVAMFLRFYLIFRVLRDRYPLYQKRGRLEADLMSKGLPPPRFDWFLSFKATFHTSGPLWLACMVVTIVCCLAYCHSLAEREFQPELFHSGVGFILYYTILLMTAGGPSVGSPCSGWGQAVGMVTCLTGVVLLALTVSVVETKLSLSEKATTALRWDEVDKAVTKERHAAARYIQRLWCASMVSLATSLTARCVFSNCSRAAHPPLLSTLSFVAGAVRARRKLNHALARQPHLRSSSSFLRQRAITRSVVSVDLAEARRRRVLTIRELGWTPMEDWSKELAEDESAELAAASDAAKVAETEVSAVPVGGAGGAAAAGAMPPELAATLNQILAAQAELGRVQESLVQAVRHSGQATAALLTARQAQQSPGAPAGAESSYVARPVATRKQPSA